MQRVSPRGDEISFALTADGGLFEKKSLLIVRSLRDVYPESPILTFIPGKSDISDTVVDELERETTVRYGDFPLDDYPHTAFQRAFELATKTFSTDYYTAIDSDAVVINRITLPRQGADLYATPMYMGIWDWQSTEGITDDWLRLFDYYGIEPPEVGNTAVTDSLSMWPPYYNSGVMVTTDDRLPGRFLEMNEELFGGDLSDTDPAIETEQVALALLASDSSVDFEELGTRQNWMMGGFTNIPDDVEVLHYQYFDTLATMRNESIKQQLSSYGAQLKPSWSDYVARTLSYLVFRGGKVLPRNVQKYISTRVLQPYFDWNTPAR